MKRRVRRPALACFCFCFLLLPVSFALAFSSTFCFYACLLLLRGPSCSHRVDYSLLPQREPQGGALQTILQGRKAETVRHTSATTPVAQALGTVPLFHLKSACGGSPTKRRATRTVSAEKRSCWSGGHSYPVTSLIVRGVSSRSWTFAKIGQEECHFFRASVGCRGERRPAVDLPRPRSTAYGRSSARRHLVLGGEPKEQYRPADPAVGLVFKKPFHILAFQPPDLRQPLGANHNPLR